MAAAARARSAVCCRSCDDEPRPSHMSVGVESFLDNSQIVCFNFDILFSVFSPGFFLLKKSYKKKGRIVLRPQDYYVQCLFL